MRTQQITQEFIDRTHVNIVSRDSSYQRRPGVFTTEHTKAAGVFALQQYLKKDAIAFVRDHEFIGANPKADKEELIKQMKNYEIIRKVPLDRVMGKVREKYSGKSAAGEQDDLITALHQAIYVAHKERELRPLTAA